VIPIFSATWAAICDFESAFAIVIYCLYLNFVVPKVIRRRELKPNRSRLQGKNHRKLGVFLQPLAEEP
jgi:hypothetical protein